MKKTLLVFALLFSFVLSAAAQHGAASSSTGSADGTGTGVGSKASENYVIAPLDLLTFRIIGEPETQSEVRVAQDGSVNLPFAGTVNFKNMTVAEAREKLYKIYDRDYFVHPQIELTVTSYAQRRIQVQGMVNKQGFVVIPPEEKMSLLGAISAAGGWSNNRLANKKAVKITREEDGKTKTYEVDATEIGPNDWPLTDGDVIFVPERVW